MKKCFSNLCAYAALTLSIVMFVLWVCNAGGFTAVSLDSFVGVIVGLLAIIVTFAIGWQIYNVIEMNRKIEQLDERLKEVQDLKEQLNAQQEKIEQQGHEACHFNFVGLAQFFFSKQDYLGAFRFYQAALNHSLKLDSLANLTHMADSVLKSIESVATLHNLPCSLYDEVQRIDKEIRQSRFFNLIQDKYEKAYGLFNKKVVRGA